MTISIPSVTTFDEMVKYANRIASRVLRLSLGAHTSDDVVSLFIEKQVRKGRNIEEIEIMLSGPKIFKYLTNIKNDIVRWEQAAKRGSDVPRVSFEEAEPILLELLPRRGTVRTLDNPDRMDAEFNLTTTDPEIILICKEKDVEMKNFLSQLLEKSRLSEIQSMIIELDRRGLTNEEISRELSIDVNTVYSRRSDAHRKLASAAKRIIQHMK